MDAKEQAIQNLLYWAKYAHAEVDAQTSHHDDQPTWLEELRAACDAAETEGVEATAFDGEKI